MTLTGFLLARIAEDEQALEGASDYETWRGVDHELAECEAKRRIVAEHDTYGGICGTCGVGSRMGERWPCRTLRLLCFTYADHPDYREEWRP